MDFVLNCSSPVAIVDILDYYAVKFNVFIASLISFWKHS